MYQVLDHLITSRHVSKRQKTKADKIKAQVEEYRCEVRKMKFNNGTSGAGLYAVKPIPVVTSILFCMSLSCRINSEYAVLQSSILAYNDTGTKLLYRTKNIMRYARMSGRAPAGEE